MDQKIENQLNLALALTDGERERTGDLNTGFDRDTDTWELIIRYSGDIETAAGSLGVRLKLLSGGYALAYVREESIEEFARLTEVIYVEKPKKLFFGLEYGTAASCIDPLQTGSGGLSGAGTIVAVIDSGDCAKIMPFSGTTEKQGIPEVIGQSAESI